MHNVGLQRFSNNFPLIYLLFYYLKNEDGFRPMKISRARLSCWPHHRPQRPPGLLRLVVDDLQHNTQIFYIKDLF